jgi:hypothetical protein
MSSTAPAIKPIETRAYGCRFRSRLEARWAVFLTELGVRWEYEHEGFVTKAGPYLPDFWLPEIRGGVWLEIKPFTTPESDGSWGSMDDDPILSAFDYATGGAQLYLAHGIPDSKELQDRFSSAYLYRKGWIEGCNEESMMFCICPICGAVGLEFDGRAARIDDCDTTKATQDWLSSAGHENKCYNYADPRIVAASIAAYSARFEHGESP